MLRAISCVCAHANAQHVVCANARSVLVYHTANSRVCAQHVAAQHFKARIGKEYSVAANSTVYSCYCAIYALRAAVCADVAQLRSTTCAANRLHVCAASAARKARVAERYNTK